MTEIDEIRKRHDLIEKVISSTRDPILSTEHKDRATLLGRIAELEAAGRLLLSWVDNWDSPFLEDDEWRETDGPKIRAVLKEQSR